MAEYYVEATTGSDANAGTSPGSGNAWATIQYALDTITPGTNGDRINVLAGETVSENGLDMATHTAPTVNAPLFIQGYDTAAGDGGQATIDCGGTDGLTDEGTDWDFTFFIDLSVSNFGANNACRISNDCTFLRCEFHNGTSDGIEVQGTARVIQCYIHNINGQGILQHSGVLIAYRNVVGDFESATNLINVGIGGASTTSAFSGSVIEENIIYLTQASATGIHTSRGFTGTCINNSIYQGSAGTGAGISVGDQATAIFNNLIEGFSGTGGRGIDYGSEPGMLTGGNAVYNCTTAYANASSEGHIALGDDETLSASPFNISGTVTAADFIPANTGNVKQGSIPTDPQEDVP